MGARIHLARTAADLDAAFRLRHEVYVEQGRYMAPVRDGRILDRFDAYPGVSTFVARIGTRVVGTSRLIVDTGIGTHVDEYMDFAPYIPPGARVGSGSMLCVHTDYRHSRGLAMSLVGMCVQHAVGHGLTHLLGAVNPEALAGFRSVGFQPLADPRHSDDKGVDFVPVLLDLADMTERIRAFVRRRDGLRLVESSERMFLERGELLFLAGAAGGEAYLVLDGELDLSVGDDSLGQIGRGAWIGELAVLLDRPRSATAVAHTDCDLLVVPRELMLSEARRDPEVALDLLRQVAQRLWDTNQRPPPEPKEEPS